MYSPQNSDPFQFHIILGENIRAKEETIKSLECALEKYIEQSNQKEKDYNDLKNDLKRERENNDDMEDILDKRDNEINQLNENIKAKNKDLESLELFVKQRVEEINNLRENNISMGNQLFDVIKLEKKVSIQENVIRELKENMKKSENDDLTNEIDNLMKDNAKLQEENREKEKLVESMNIEK